MSRTVFVTGASGFIGSAVAKRFSAAGYKVFGLTRSEDKSKSLLQAEITPVIGEVNKPETYEKIIEQVSVVVHTATGVTSTPVEDDMTVVETVARVSAKSANQKLFILTSGCLLYGGKIESDTYFNEESPLNPPSGMVGWRIKIEQLVIGNKDFIGAIVRPAFLYGFQGSYTAPFFQMAEAKKLIVSGNPDKKWSFIHATDLAEGYLLIADAPRSVIKDQIFNFADGTRATIKEITIAAGKAAGHTGEITYVPAGNDFMGINCEQNCLQDCTKARLLLGWVPRHFGFLENIAIHYASWKAYQK